MTDPRSLGRAALAEYPAVGPVAEMALVAESFNTIFRVVTLDGVEAALRVGPVERIHAEGTELTEAAWMRALHAEAGIRVAGVHDAADGAPFVRLTAPASPEPRICMLFEWIDGDVLGAGMSADAARRSGTLLALLHEHAAGWPDADHPVLKADRVLYWQVDDRLDELRPVQPLIADALTRVDAVLAAIWADPPHRPHLLHGDFTPDNVMTSGPDLVPIDFQDLVVGFDIQDLAIALIAFGRFDDADDLRQEFRAGYRTIRPWPDLDPDVLDALTAARRLHQLNLGLNLRRPGIESYIARSLELLAPWMG